jgi:hypothetical protein
LAPLKVRVFGGELPWTQTYSVAGEGPVGGAVAIASSDPVPEEPSFAGTDGRLAAGPFLVLGGEDLVLAAASSKRRAPSRTV